MSWSRLSHALTPGARSIALLAALAAAAVWSPRSSAAGPDLPLALAGRAGDVWALDPGRPSPPPAQLGLGADPDLLAPAPQAGASAGGAVEVPAAASDAATPHAPTLAVFPRRLVRDLGALVTRPLTFDGRDWAHLAIGVGAVAVVSVFDTRIRDAALAHTSSGARNFANRIRPLGTWGGVAAMGVLLGAGELAGDTELARTGADGIEASLFAGAVVAPIVKELAGRQRPNAASQSGAFEPVSSGQSFPSGEGTEAFALAAVVSNHTESPVLRGVAWGLAGLVGWERIALNAHWASDVVAGALIGATVGKWVTRRSWPGQEGGAAISVQPLVAPGVLGVGGSLSW